MTFASASPPAGTPGAPRKRLSRDQRFEQLIDTGWRILGAEGADALTLGRLAEQAGVTKPVVYDHFGSREGLLAALFRDFDRRQTETMDSALREAEARLDTRAAVIAHAYVECIVRQGQEIPGILAALAGSPEMSALIREHEQAFMAKCRRLLAPFAEPHDLRPAALRAMLGAAEALSRGAAAGDLDEAAACAELCALIVQTVERSGDTPPRVHALVDGG
ncbi:TetR/AcrR family transcriptional regulator [Sphingopyxis sp. MWB1]|uniref:TetR/AcrR family transcriptional regulator n=1 Tax=Sphingopyxis sp. MWB1 TaxID=1537715 RepID=UPI00068DEFE3|nr:TetR/AcrR family transcriptional regulator [Sphingopyxis sp. MWB1]